MVNQRGLHARASAKFVNAVAELPEVFEPTYYIYKDDVASDLPQPADNLDVIDFGVDPFLEDFHRERVYAHKGQPSP